MSKKNKFQKFRGVRMTDNDLKAKAITILATAMFCLLMIIAGFSLSEVMKTLKSVSTIALLLMIPFAIYKQINPL